MSDEGFFRRWSRRKHETQLGRDPTPEPGREDAPDAIAELAPAAPAATLHGRPAAHAGEGEGALPRLPTLADVEELTPDSDYSSFVARGVDGAVRRTALKKLFADPHFNVMDRLDVYIDDYTKPSPVSPAMLASLQHARSVFERLNDDEDTVLADAVAAPGPGMPVPPAEVAATCQDGAASAGAGEIASPAQSDLPADAQEAMASQAAQAPGPDGSAAASRDAGGTLEHEAPYQQHLPETETR